MTVGGGAGVGEETGGGPGLGGEDVALDGGEFFWWSACGVEFGGGEVGGGGYALIEEIVGVLPGAGVAVALGDAEAAVGLRLVAAVEIWLRGVGER